MTETKKLIQDFEEARQGDKYWSDKAFMSTSRIDSELKKNISIGVIIEGKSGKKIEHFSYNSQEKEVLFDKGTRFKVKSIRTGGDIPDKYNMLYLVELIEE